jgi:hypothetical protein
MSWQATARAAVQRVGVDPRYLRRLRWIAKAGAIRSVGAPLRSNLRFALLDPEPANFTYELANEGELAEWVAAAASCERAHADRLLQEVRSDEVLARRLDRATARRWLWAKRRPPYGKRAGWYAIARITKPRLIVETGVHDGLGSLLLLRALERNSEEGAHGRLTSFDVNPAAGWLVGSHPLWELRIEPAREGLAQALAAGPPVGMFIHDSLHTYENERFELRAAAAHLGPGGVLVSDNAHGTTAFAETCAESGLQSAVFYERSRGHFYPGGAVGAGWR